MNYPIHSGGGKSIYESHREAIQDFVDKLNSLSVPARYPDELERLLKDYKKDLTEEILNQTKDLLLWLKQKK